MQLTVNQQLLLVESEVNINSTCYRTTYHWVVTDAEEAHLLSCNKKRTETRSVSNVSSANAELNTRGAMLLDKEKAIPLIFFGKGMADVGIRKRHCVI